MTDKQLIDSYDETQEPCYDSLDTGTEEEEEEVWGRLIPLNSTNSPNLLLGTKKESYLFGQNDDADFIISGGAVEANHCRIFRMTDDDSPPCVMIENFSDHGMIVHRRMLKKDQKTLLIHGSEIQIGDRQFIFHPDRSTLLSGELGTSPFHEKYDTQIVVGRGNFSVVKVGVNKDTGKRVAVKIIEKSKFTFNSKVLTALEREVEIFKAVQPHPNVVGFEDSFEEKGTLYIVMEYCPSGDLLKYVLDRKKLNEKISRNMTLQMITVLKHLKTKGIVHRDLKPDNFLCDGSTLKLADFGVAKQSQNKQLSTVCGTPVYLAPEIIFSEQCYDDRVDLYSVGVILFFMLSGTIPFIAIDDTDLYTKIKLGSVDWSSPAWKDVSDAAIDLIKSLMKVDPDQRIKLEDVEEHWWFTDNDAVLSDPRISRSHCTISFEGEDFLNPVLIVEGQNKITVNQLPVEKRSTLRDGDVIQLAPRLKNQPILDYMFKMFIKSPVVIPTAPSPVVIDSQNTLIGVKRKLLYLESESAIESKKKQVFSCDIFRLIASTFAETFLNNHREHNNCSFDGKNITIGRGPECNVVVENAGVSGVQCKVYWDGEKAILEDFSSNGTFVNKKIVGRGKQKILEDGDVICVCPISAAERIDFIFTKIVKNQTDTKK
ncbi:Checkpoint kinase 2 [Physocladia obscura]|uniref:Checkpoint kinase 2 n=1 Tax=Physocladia obscura TaxID=109957 RepID=A0AAD5XCC6_9FUNG|nr:Checkpoint kinase 2 [Physocladia obscura]